MEKRILGRSGIEVGAIGMGCWAIGGPWRFRDGEGGDIPAGWGAVDDDESITAIHAALDAGVTLFDTAANYGAGHSEEILGRALGKRRDEVVIATKFGYLIDPDTRTVDTDNSRVLPNLKSDCESSLRRLGTDHIDVYQLHVGSYPADDAPAVVDALEKLVAEGKIRSYGWSTDDPDRAAVFARGQHCSAIQFAYNVFSEKFGVRDVLAEADVGGLARSPLAMGILTGKFTPDTRFAEDDVRTEMDFTEGRPALFLDIGQRLKETMTAGGHSPAQAALAWVLTSDERVVPIPGFRTAGQVAENVAALDAGLLSSEQMITLEGIRAASIDTVRSHYNPEAAEEAQEE